MVSNPAVRPSPAASAAPAGHRPARASMAPLQLCPEPGSAKAARDFTAAVLCTWRLADVLPDARRAVAWRVTSARRHGPATARLPAPRTPRPSPPIGLRLLRHPTG